VHGKLSLVALVGCGRLHFEPIADAPGDTPAPCTQWSAFSAPVHVVELGAPGTDDWGPALSADGLTIYFYSGRTPTVGGFDIWTATRATEQALWTTPSDVMAINSAVEDRVPWISDDGLTIGFASARAGGPGGLDLWWAMRATPTATFDPPQLIPNVNTPGNELGSMLSASGLDLYIVSGGAGLDIFVATRATPADAFAAPVLVPSLNSPQNERSVTLSADELEAFIVTNRGGADYDIYRATRPDLATPFSTPTRVDELSSTGDDSNPTLSRDGTQVLYNYNAPVTGGDSEIWEATRTCLSGT
jgi:hypothetical protein